MAHEQVSLVLSEVLEETDSPNKQFDENAHWGGWLFSYITEGKSIVF